MNKFIALLKFEFMSNSSRFKDEKLFSRIKRILMVLFGALSLELIFVYAVNVVMKVFINEGMQHEFIIFFSFFIMLLHFLLGLTMSIKSLYIKEDLSLLKLPVGGLNVFSAKFTYMFLKQIFYSFVISLPIFLLFGIKTMQGLSYWLMLVPNIIFLPIIPFLFSLLLSVPVMYIIKVFKNKFLVLLAFYTILLIIAFTLYIFALRFILNIFESGNFANVFDDSTISSIKKFSSYLYLPLLFKNSLLFYNFWRSAVINFAIVVFLATLIYFFAEKCYFSFLISSKNQNIFHKNTKVVYRSPTLALMVKEFKNIFRSTNYAFQYLTIVITTPLMVYFSSVIASSVGTPILGKGVLPGIVVLILIMFLSIGTSFAATSITREGKIFYLTKIVPINFTRQILVKFAIYLIISIPAIFISTFILALAGIIQYVPALLIAIALSFVIVGNICHSIFMDIKRPQFQQLENGEVVSNNKNTSTSIGIGFAISFLMGVGGIILSIFVSISSIYMVLFGFGVPFAIIETLRLFCKLDKYYEAIEV